MSPRSRSAAPRATPQPPPPAPTVAPARALKHMRVVVFSDAIPGRNGVGTFYDDLAAALDEHVGAIQVIAPPLEASPDERGWSMPLPGDPTQRMHVPWIPQIWKQVRWTRPHVILAATPSLYGVTGLLMARRAGSGAALCYHTEFPKLAETYWTGIRARIAPGLLTLWDRLLLRWSPAVLAPNEELAGVLARKGRRDAHVMATPAPRLFVETPPARPPESVARVAFIGRLAPEKRIDQVLAAARALPDIAFRVLGDGPERPAVVAAAAELENLDYTPWVDRDGVLQALDRTDVLVLPSRHETFGTAAFESMVRGRLTMVSPECGITGWPRLAPGLFRMEPGESVADALPRLQALAPERLRGMARAARGAARDVHAGAVQQWLELLTTLAARSKAPSP